MLGDWSRQTAWIARRAVRVILDMALPPICRGCGHRILPHDPGPLCFACRDSMPLITEAHRPCARCGAADPIADEDGRCRVCPPTEAIHRMASGCRYAGLAITAIDRFKYGKRTEYTTMIASWMVPALERLDPDRTAVLIPIPLHPSRKRERGFNQAELLTRELARLTGHRFVENLLFRTRITTTQTRLNKEERTRNVQGAFQASSQVQFPTNPDGPAPLILVDDVATTGATLVAAAKGLLQAAPKPSPAILALTACRATLLL
jgi:ComF family protein